MLFYNFLQLIPTFPLHIKYMFHELFCFALVGLALYCLVFSNNLLVFFNKTSYFPESRLIYFLNLIVWTLTIHFLLHICHNSFPNRISSQEVFLIYSRYVYLLLNFSLSATVTPCLRRISSVMGVQSLLKRSESCLEKKMFMLCRTMNPKVQYLLI